MLRRAWVETLWYSSAVKILAKPCSNLKISPTTKAFFFFVARFPLKQKKDPARSFHRFFKKKKKSVETKVTSHASVHALRAYKKKKKICGN
jgi:hypothetical protein